MSFPKKKLEPRSFHGRERKTMDRNFTKLSSLEIFSDSKSVKSRQIDEASMCGQFLYFDIFSPQNLPSNIFQFYFHQVNDATAFAALPTSNPVHITLTERKTSFALKHGAKIS